MDETGARRFSQLYLKRGEPASDSMRMRRRLGAVFWDCGSDIDLHSLVKRRLGVEVPYGAGGGNWTKFSETCEVRDLLDTITLIFQRRKEKRFPTDRFIAEISAIFLEENVAYRVDRQGVVHFAIDAEFQSVRASALAVLGAARYSNVLEQFEAAYRAMDEVPPNGKLAVRSVFAASEGLFRLMFPQAPRLAGDQIEKFISSGLARDQADKTNLEATRKWVRSFKEWVDAAHFFRHEPGAEEPSQPPLDLAVGLLSSGAAYLRWLAERDQRATNG